MNILKRYIISWFVVWKQVLISGRTIFYEKNLDKDGSIKKNC